MTNSVKIDFWLCTKLNKTCFLCRGTVICNVVIVHQICSKVGLLYSLSRMQGHVLSIFKKCLFYSSVWRKHNCNEWHHILSRIPWWVSKLSRLLLASKSATWEWNLHQFHSSSNRAHIWFHNCLVRKHFWHLFNLHVTLCNQIWI